MDQLSTTAFWSVGRDHSEERILSGDGAETSLGAPGTWPSRLGSRQSSVAPACDLRGIMSLATGPDIYAASDLHVEVPENRAFVEGLESPSTNAWLILCGDVGEVMADVQWALAHLARRFSKTIWVPGNHELWTRSDDEVQLRGRHRYDHLVEFCRSIGIVTPEDPYPVWRGTAKSVVVAPLFTLYDYTFGLDIAPTKARAMALARRAGVVCSDELVLFTDPYPSIEAWCEERLSLTSRRLANEAQDQRTLLINHFPLHRDLTRLLYHQEFAQWCGTVKTETWHRHYRAAAVIYGHLHIPRTSWQDGVRFEEVSIGYPREWTRRQTPPALRRVFSEDSADA
jgi:predicted phosphodiesterase